MRVSFGNRTEEIRLIGVDTPETVHPTKPVQCWGPEASSQTKTWLPKGTQVYILRDVEARDKYGRLLAYVYRSADNLFINKELVAGGWARPYPYEPNTSLQAVFAQAAYEAQTSNLGLWAHC
jgi:micrococcal nuclease